MNRILALVFVATVAAGSLSGCTTMSPMNGSIYTDLSGPISSGPAATAAKRGEAKATGIVGVVLGDVSIETAMKNGGITKVHHVDVKVRNILGVYAEYTTIVYGE